MMTSQNFAMVVAIILPLIAGGEKARASDTLSSDKALSVGILGDSLATGAATSPELVFDGDRLWDVFKGERSIKPTIQASLETYLASQDLSPPIVLPPSRREYQGGLAWVFAHLQRALSARFLNTEEYSWGYLLARKLGASADHIFLASENGAKTAAFINQADRLLEFGGGMLPAKIFALYSGNDLCAPHINNITPVEKYKKDMMLGLKYLITNGTPYPHTGTDIFVLGFLPVMQLILNDSILNKEVEAFGKPITCRQLKERFYQPEAPLTQAKHLETLYMSHLIPPNPARYCPTLFALPFLAKSEAGVFFAGSVDQRFDDVTAPGERMDRQKLSLAAKAKWEEMLSIISSRIRHYRAVSQEAVDEVNRWAKVAYPNKAIKITYLPHTEHLEFTGDDVGADCFHLNLTGQMKIAKAVESGM